MKRTILSLVIAAMAAPALVAQPPPTGCYKCITAPGGGQMCHLQQQDRSGQLACDNPCYLYGGPCAPNFLAPDGQLQLIAMPRELGPQVGVAEVVLTADDRTTTNWKGTVQHDCAGWIVARLQSREYALTVRERSRRLVI